MKKIFIAAAMIIMCSVLATAQDNSERSIVVHGEAEMSIAADRAILQVAIRATGRSYAKALADAQKSADKLQEKLFAIGLREQDISRAIDADSKSALSGFFGNDEKHRAKVGLRISVVGAALLGEVIAVIQDLDGGKMPAIHYEHSHATTVQQEVLEMAMVNARQRAEAMAEAVGAVVGDLLFAEELQAKSAEGQYPYRRSRELLFSAKVKTVFAISSLNESTQNN